MTKRLRDKITDALHKRGLDPQYHGILRAAGARTGIGAPGTRGEPARLYVVELMAYYLGKGPVPIPPRELSTFDLERWVKGRTLNELELEAHRLPAIDYGRTPAA